MRPVLREKEVPGEEVMLWPGFAGRARRLRCYTRKPFSRSRKGMAIITQQERTAHRYMRIAKLEFIPVSVAYTHREVSSLVNRDGVTDIVVKATTDNGIVGWGESSSGADVGSVLEALRAMSPFVIGRSP